MDLLIFLVLLTLGYLSGTWAEKRHYKRIETREAATLSLPAMGFRKMPPTDQPVLQTRMVMGSAVISIDYFKRILANLRFLFGGRVKSYESLIDRARREALLRMKEQAPGAEFIVCVRIETANIGSGSKKGKTTCVEAHAYGTAVWLRPETAGGAQ